MSEAVQGLDPWARSQDWPLLAAMSKGSFYSLTRHHLELLTT